MISTASFALAYTLDWFRRCDHFKDSERRSYAWPFAPAPTTCDWFFWLKSGSKGNEWARS